MRKIKSSTLYKHDYVAENIKAEEPEVKGSKYSHSEFDKNGNMILEIKYDSSGKIEDKYENKYDEKGNLIEEISYLDKNEIAEHKTYERDEKGKIIKSFVHYQDGTKDTIEYKYDAMQNLTEKITVDSYGEIEAKETAKYKDGKLILKEKYEYNELMKKETFELDNSGNITEHNVWSVEEKNVTFRNTFDEKGNLLEQRQYDKKEKLTGKAGYTYNDNGKLIIITEETPYGQNTTKITYNERGNAIEQIETNKEDEVNNSVGRKFNESNNVIETKVFINFHGQGINQQYVLKYEYKYF